MESMSLIRPNRPQQDHVRFVARGAGAPSCSRGQSISRPVRGVCHGCGEEGHFIASYPHSSKN